MDVLFWSIGILVLVFAIVSISTTWLQEYFIFRPEKLPPDYAFTFEKPLEEHWIDTPHGGRIHALWRKTGPQARGVVLYFHGNAGSLKRWGHLYQFFERHQYDLFIIDYRGYGKSKGKRRSRWMLQDAERVYEYVRQFYPPSRIVLYGRSLGSTFALHVAARHAAKMTILETPFSSMEDLFYAYFPFMPRIFPFYFRFRNRRNLEQVKGPVYLFHGTDDWVVPYRVAWRLHRHLKDKDRFITIDGGGHNDLLYFDRYQAEIAWMLADANKSEDESQK